MATGRGPRRAKRSCCWAPESAVGCSTCLYTRGTPLEGMRTYIHEACWGLGRSAAKCYFPVYVLPSLCARGRNAARKPQERSPPLEAGSLIVGVGHDLEGAELALCRAGLPG